MAITLKSLVGQLPQETSERVETARRQWNAQLRTTLRIESRLLLKRSKPAVTDAEEEPVAVPVQVVAGLPDPVKEMQFPDDSWLIAILSRYRHELQQLHNGTIELRKLVADVTKDPR